MRMKSQMELMKSEHSKFKSKVVRKNTSLMRSIESNIQLVKKCRSDLGVLKKVLFLIINKIK